MSVTDKVHPVSPSFFTVSSSRFALRRPSCVVPEEQEVSEIALSEEFASLTELSATDDRFVLAEVIKRGTGSEFFRGHDNQKNCDVGIMRIDLDKLDDTCLMNMNRGLAIQRKLQHPYIIGLYGLLEKNFCLHLAMELGTTDLQSILSVSFLKLNFAF